MPDGGGGFAPGDGLQLAVAGQVYSPQAAVVILGRELPQEDPASLPRIHNEIQDLITPMVDTFPLKKLARGLLGISNHMFPDNFLQVTPMARQLLVDHVYSVLHEAMPPHLRFDMDWSSGINWAVFRNHVLDAKSDLAALALMNGNVKGMNQPGQGGVPPIGGALPPGAHGPGGVPLIPGGIPPGGAMPPADGMGGAHAPADGTPSGNYVWANGAPRGQPLGYVQQILIDDMKVNGWHGMVRLDGAFHAVLPENSAPAQGKDQVGLQGGTTTQCISQLGLRTSGQFGVNYEYMGIDVMKQICSTYDNVEQYVKQKYGYLESSERTGLRAQYRELVDSAVTADALVRRVAMAGQSQEELKKDDLFEMHMAKIALYEYTSRTNNHGGAQFISGRAVGLLPTKLAQKAADFANASKKLQTAVAPNSYKGPPKGYGKGQENQPPKCFYCQQMGHIAKDCPQKKADIEAGVVQPKARGKGRPGVRARAKIVAKIEGDDDDA